MKKPTVRPKESAVMLYMCGDGTCSVGLNPWMKWTVIEGLTDGIVTLRRENVTINISEKEFRENFEEETDDVHD